MGRFRNILSEISSRSSKSQGSSSGGEDLEIYQDEDDLSVEETLSSINGESVFTSTTRREAVSKFFPPPTMLGPRRAQAPNAGDDGSTDGSSSWATFRFLPPMLKKTQNKETYDLSDEEDDASWTGLSEVSFRDEVAPPLKTIYSQSDAASQDFEKCAGEALGDNATIRPCMAAKEGEEPVSTVRRPPRILYATIMFSFLVMVAAIGSTLFIFLMKDKEKRPGTGSSLTSKDRSKVLGNQEDPTNSPTTAAPTAKFSCTPSFAPSLSPSKRPTTSPTVRVLLPPPLIPSEAPSSYPSQEPTLFPSKFPTLFPSKFPSLFPSEFPSLFPSEFPSEFPSSFPSLIPSDDPSAHPSPSPESSPSLQPTARFESTKKPSTNPSAQPTLRPSTVWPSNKLPTYSEFPSSFPSLIPSEDPSTYPSPSPESSPSLQPTARFESTKVTTSSPSAQPTLRPSTV